VWIRPFAILCRVQRRYIDFSRTEVSSPALAGEGEADQVIVGLEHEAFFLDGRLGLAVKLLARIGGGQANDALGALGSGWEELNDEVTISEGIAEARSVGDVMGGAGCLIEGAGDRADIPALAWLGGDCVALF
jgi:hypothetical protein